MIAIYTYQQTGMQSAFPLFLSAVDLGPFKGHSWYAKFKRRVFKKEQMTPEQQANSEMSRLYGSHLKRRVVEVLVLALGIALLCVGIIGALVLLPIGGAGSYAMIGAGGCLLLDGACALVIDFGRLKLTQMRCRGIRLPLNPRVYKDSQGQTFTEFYMIDPITAKPVPPKVGDYDLEIKIIIDIGKNQIVFPHNASEASIYYHTLIFPPDNLKPGFRIVRGKPPSHF